MRKNRINSDRLLGIDLEREVLFRLCKEHPSPRAQTVTMLADNGEWDQLIQLNIDPLHYTEADVDRFRSDYQVTKFLAKSKNIPSLVDTRAVAWDAFLAAESACRDTNDNLLARISDSSDRTRAILRIARERVHRVLGRLDEHALEKIYSMTRFGPGATRSVRGDDVSMSMKYDSRLITCTPRALNAALFTLPTMWKRRILGFEPVSGSTLSFVAKNAKTDRAICIEPDVNIFYQLGIGAYLKERLKQFGVDLYDQSANQRLAGRAYRDGLSTIDLRAASDTISVRVVEWLLPSSWTRLLATFRSDYTTYNSVEIPLEKWSSMGNGYTFELESLIFHAVLYGVKEFLNSDSPIGTYGDDLIVGRDMSEDVIDVLKLLGFDINKDKSFTDGLFYESCGSDFFCGFPVRPIFSKGKLDDKTDTNEKHDFIYGLANQLCSWSIIDRAMPFRDSRVLPAWLYLFGKTRAEYRHRIPTGFTGGFWSSFDEATPSFSRRHGEFRFKSLVRIPRRRPGKDSSLLLAALNGQYTAFSEKERLVYGHIESVRGSTKYSLRTQATISWPELGPWV